MLYITTNRKNLEPKRILFLPYLHERKIYLNQIEPAHKFFYNVVTEALEDEDDTSSKDEDGTETKGRKFIFAINLT